MKNKKIAFDVRQFILTGAQVATYDYADYWEKLYGGDSYILGWNADPNSFYMQSFSKFKDRFNDRVLLYDPYKMDQAKKLMLFR